MAGYVNQVFIDYAGGVDASARNFRLLRQDQVQHLINGTVRNGWVKTRPKFVQKNLFFESAADELIFRRGKWQGEFYYRYGNNQNFYFAVDGNLFAYNPLTGDVVNVNPGGVRSLSKKVHFIYFSGRAQYVIANDGYNRPVIIEGLSSRISDASVNEVGVGLSMSDGWGYLSLVSPDARRITYSDHEMDPTPGNTALTFNSGSSYYLFAPFFEVPSCLGKIVATTYLPSSNTATGLGGELVFCEFGTMLYAIGIDRTQWTSQNIASMVLPTVGCCAHRSVFAKENDVFFSDQNGRIRSLKIAKQDETLLNIARFDAEVFPYFHDEAAYLRRWRCAMDFGGRLYFSVQPEVINISEARFNVRHLGMIVLENDLISRYQSSDKKVWNGLWTGTCPLGMAKGYFSTDQQLGGKEIGIIISSDNDGNTRIYEIDEENQKDVVANNSGDLIQRPVQMTIVPSWIDFKDFTLPKKIEGGFLRIGDFNGDLKIVGRLQLNGSDALVPWFTHYAKNSSCLEISPLISEGECQEEISGECALKQKIPNIIPRLNFPTPSLSNTDCYTNGYIASMRPILDFFGDVELNEMFFEASPLAADKRRNIICQKDDAKDNSTTACKWEFWEYARGMDLLEEKEQPKREICQP